MSITDNVLIINETCLGNVTQGKQKTKDGLDEAARTIFGKSGRSTVKFRNIIVKAKVDQAK
ncbi:MAG: hypothetical protein V4805_09850 [Pseudomonadota bacterium]